MVQFFLHKNTQKNASEFRTTDDLTWRLHTEQDDWHQWVKKQQCVASICSRFQIIFPTQGLGVQTAFLIYPLIQQGVGLDRWAVCRYCGLYGLYARHSASFIANNTHNKSPNPNPKKKTFSLKSSVVCSVVFLESLTASPAEQQQITHSAAHRHWAWCRRGIEKSHFPRRSLACFVESLCWSMQTVGAVTLSWHFSWAVDWQDFPRCHSSPSPSWQGPSVSLGRQSVTAHQYMHQ